MERAELQSIIESGGIIAYPTDTIRGIGCDATNVNAVENIFSLKMRPKKKSLIVVMASEEMLHAHGIDLTPEQRLFLSRSTKPVSMILSEVRGLAANVYHEDGTVAVRIVRESDTNEWADWCHSFIQQCGRPLVSTSANLSGDQTPRTFDEIMPEIIEGIDGYADPEIAKIPGEPSQIVRIDTDGKVAIVRP